MRKIFKFIVVKILQWEARLVLAKYKPKIIGVTGSVGKTSTKDAIYEVVKDHLSAGKSDKSYNSVDFGIALTVIGGQSAWHSILGWLDVMAHGLSLIIFKKEYPKWLVLEVGLEFPGDIEQVVKWVKFDLVVVTYLPDVPVHVEFFKTKEDVIKEKMLLAYAVSPSGKVFVNADDKNILPYLSDIKAEIVTFGQNEKADYRSCQTEVFYEKEGDLDMPRGLSFELIHNGKNLAVKINGVIGEHQIYPILAALAVGDALEIPMMSMVESVGKYVPPSGRLRLIEGIKETIILDDTYNASPAAVSAGLMALGNLTVSGRRIAAIGDMLQLGNFTPEAHREIGNKCAEICNFVVTVGLRSKFIDEALLNKNFSAEKIKHFDNSLEAGQYLQNIIEKGDVIFVKGSQAMRMEKIVGEVMAHPEDKGKLLVRQEKEWN